jgi:hypothetical protein
MVWQRRRKTRHDNGESPMTIPPATAFSRARLLALSVLMVAGLGACVASQKADLKCEPGVDDLSRAVDVAPGNC